MDKKKMKISDEEMKFLQDIVSKRAPGPIKRREILPLISQLVELRKDGYQRSVSTIYDVLNRLAGGGRRKRQNLYEEMIKERIGKMANIFEKEVRFICSQVERRLREIEKDNERLRKENEALKTKLREREDALRELTPLRAALEAVDMKKIRSIA